ncbi:glycosyltransferase [Pectinatus frisingensis]|uniref:glycosyltransferase n=1 Tax=Pectinatus frisingensis TaxID=865 RepID=UPI0018C7A2B4|nr:glycosyltransferase [Pectinatus frisingensis]
MTKILISIVMATYNDRVKYLELAIDSILKQSYNSFELIIVDDSDDVNCIAYLEKKAKMDKRIIVIHNEKKLGFVKSLNVGLSRARGKYIARMDSDDISLPNRLLEEINYLEEHDNVSILGTCIYIIDDDGNVTGKRIYKIDNKDIKKIAFFRNPMAHPTVMFRSSIFKKLVGYNETFLMAEDYELWLRALKKNIVFHNLPEKLLKYRIGRNYYRKRNKKNWYYNLKAKCENGELRILCIAGIVFSIVMYILPQNIISFLYNIERRKLN